MSTPQPPQPTQPTTSRNLSSALTLKVTGAMKSAQVPRRGAPQAAGFNLYASQACVVPPGGNAIVKT
eukprot:4438393-Karenia_brevis.AAC.1